MTGASGRRSVWSAGEQAAADWYQEHGFEVVARNWRCREGEIDLIARRGRLLVFCEVKARTSDAFGSPLEAVTPTKQARLRRLAGIWLHQAGRDPGTGAGGGGSGARQVRFDVASVLGGQVEVVENAF